MVFTRCVLSISVVISMLIPSKMSLQCGGLNSIIIINVLGSTGEGMCALDFYHFIRAV